MTRAAQNMLVKGTTSGTAVPAGYVGEIISTTLAGVSQSSPVTGTVYYDSGTLTLTPGRWRIHTAATAQIITPGSISAGNNPHGIVGLYQNTTNLCYAQFSALINGVEARGTGALTAEVSISSGTSYRVGVSFNGGTSTVGTLTLLSSANGSLFYAVRIA